MSGHRTCFQEGRVVYLRALVRDDIPRWAAWFNDRAVTRDMNKGTHPNTIAQQTEHFEHLQRSRSDVQLGIVTCTDDALVGIIGIHQIDWLHRRGDMSIVIGEADARGQGMATEAIALMVAHGFGKMNLHRLGAGMWATNIASRRAFEKNGFSTEGTLREAFWHEDRYIDEIRLGLLRAEWEGRTEADA